MGFLKKITRPISRALDKIVPNEIKPALPFLAAAAPFMAPGLMSIGGNTMLSRALMSGGLNLGSQLAQEGSEGDFSALSLALASGIGALSAPGTPSYGTSDVMVEGGTSSAGDILRTKAAGMDSGITKSGLEFLGKGSDKLIGLQEGLAADGIFSKAGAKALSIPFTQGTMDLGVAETRRFNKQQIIDDALGALDDAADGAARASAIRLAMQQYGFTEDEITETISSAGYRAGGRVGFKNAGIAGLAPGQMDTESSKESSYEIDTKPIIIKFYSKEDSGRRNEAFYEVINPLTGNKSNISQEDYIEKYGEPKAKGGRVGFQGGGMDARQMYITEPGIMGNPAVMEKIENMREFMIANPDIEDITDYSEKYESKDPEFEGIKGAVKEINKDEINEEKEILEDNNMFSNLINKVSSVFVDEKGDYRSAIQKAKFALADIVGGKGYDFVTGAEWYNKLDDETQKEILLMKQKIRDNPEAYSFSPRMKQLTEQPVYDEEFAGKFGYGSRYANGGRIHAEEGGLMNLGGREMDMRGGGFIPIGKKERADDVPARLSKNEFVMTADAVKAAGGGSVNKGAKRMYNLMNNLEARV